MRPISLVAAALACLLLVWTLVAIALEASDEAPSSRAGDLEATSEDAPRAEGRLETERTERSGPVEPSSADAAPSEVEPNAHDAPLVTGDAADGPKSLVLHVLDEDGRGLPRIPLRLIYTYSNATWSSMLWRGESDELGRAGVAPGVRMPPRGVLVATLDRPLFDAPAIELDAAALPRGPVELRLKAPAQWVPRVVDANGEPHSGERSIVFYRSAGAVEKRAPWVLPVLARNESGARSEPVLVPEGRALSAHVEDTSGDRLPGTRVDLEPLAAGETRTVKLVLGAKKPWVHLRLLDEAGKPFASAQVLAWCGPFAETWNTDAEGDLRMRVDAPWTPGEARPLRVLAYDDRSYFPPRGPEWSAEHQDLKVELDLSYELRSGEHDLGTHTLRRSPPILEGRVLDDRDQPVPYATVVVDTAIDGEGEERVFRWLAKLDCDEGGRFALRGTCEARRFRLQAEREELIPAAHVECERDARGLELYLLRPARLRGRVALPDPSKRLEFYLEVKAPPPAPEGETAPKPKGRFEIAPFENYCSLDENAGFDFGLVPPVAARLRLLASEDDRILAELLLELEPGKRCDDPRLAPLVLR